MTFTLWNSLGTPAHQTSTLLEKLLPPLCIYDLQGQTRYVSQKFLQLLQIQTEKVDFFRYFPSLSTNLMVLQDYWHRALQGEEITFTYHRSSPALKLNCLLQLLPQDHCVALIAEVIEANQPGVLTGSYEKTILSLLNGSGFAIALTNSTGKVLQCNQSFYKLLSIPPHISLNLEAFIHPDDRDLDRDLKQRLLNQEIGFYTIEKRLITDRQTIIWANFRVSHINVPSSQTGNEACFAVLMEDVTEQHKLYEALIRTEEKWKSFVFNSSHLFLQVSDIGHILYASPAVERILDYQEAELLDRSIIELIHPHDLPNFGLAFNQWQSHQKSHSAYLDPANLECRWRSKSNQWIYFHVQGQRFPMALGIEGVAISGYSINDRQHLELESKANEKKLELLSNDYSLQIVKSVLMPKRSSNCQYN